MGQFKLVFIESILLIFSSPVVLLISARQSKYFMKEEKCNSLEVFHARLANNSDGN